MGKVLIIKNADFAANAIPLEYVPYVTQNSDSRTFLTYNVLTDITDNGNELAGKTITGFDLLFENKANSRPLSMKVYFLPPLQSPIECDVTCSFDNQESEKIVHYNLDEPYTFGEHDTIRLHSYGNTFSVPGSPGGRAGCALFRQNTAEPGYAFTLDSVPSSLFQPFAKLYLL